MKIHPVEAELFRTDGRTDRRPYMKKLVVAIRSFAKAPKMRFWIFLPDIFIERCFK